MRTYSLTIGILLIALGCAARILPHPPNFAPIGAIAVFGGMYLPKRFALLLPISAMFISDLVIGFYSPQIMIAVYGGFMIMGAIGLIVKKKKNLSTVIGGTVLGSVLFFLITNAAVWLFGTMYPHSLVGLGQSYLMGLPFFRNSLLGDVFYIGLLAGAYEALLYLKYKRTTLPEHI